MSPTGLSSFLRITSPRHQRANVSLPSVGHIQIGILVVVAAAADIAVGDSAADMVVAVVVLALAAGMAIAVFAVERIVLGLVRSTAVALAALVAH